MFTCAAINRGRDDVVALILQKEEHFNLNHKFGVRSPLPLVAATLKRNFGISEKLLQRGANVFLEGTNGADARLIIPILMVIERDDSETFRIFCENCKDSDLLTLAEQNIAVQNKDLLVVRQLLNAGVPVQDGVLCYGLQSMDSELMKDIALALIAQG